MTILAIELSKASFLPFVYQAYLSEQQDRVVIEVVTDPAAGLPRENILYFEAANFSADKVKRTIERIQTEFSPVPVVR